MSVSFRELLDAANTWKDTAIEEATIMLGWWLEDSKTQLKESKNCSKTSWGEFGGL